MSRSILGLRPIDVCVFLEVGDEAVSGCAFFFFFSMRLMWAQVPCRFLLFWLVCETETGRVSSEEQAQ